MNFRKNKIFVLLVAMALLLLFVGAVSAANNTTSQTITLKQNNPTIQETLKSDENNKVIEKKSTQNTQVVNTQKPIKCKIETEWFKEKNNNVRMHLWLRGPDYMLIGGVKLKIHETYKGKSKDYYITTLSNNQKEKIFKHLGVGTHKFVITSMNSKYQASSTTKITIPKKTIKSIIIKGIGKGYKTVYKSIYPDSELCFYREIKQNPGDERLFVELWHPYVSNQPFKIVKSQYFFKNAYTGKIIKRTMKKVYKSGLITFTMLKIPAWYYKPLGAKVWYTPI